MVYLVWRVVLGWSEGLLGVEICGSGSNKSLLVGVVLCCGRPEGLLGKASVMAEKRRIGRIWHIKGNGTEIRQKCILPAS